MKIVLALLILVLVLAAGVGIHHRQAEAEPLTVRQRGGDHQADGKAKNWAESAIGVSAFNAAARSVAAKKDRDAAVAELAQLLSEVSEARLEDALEAADQMKSPAARDRLKTALLLILARTRPEKAMAAARGMSLGNEASQASAVQLVFREWTRTSARQAIGWLKTPDAEEPANERKKGVLFSELCESVIGVQRNYALLGEIAALREGPQAMERRLALDGYLRDLWENHATEREAIRSQIDSLAPVQRAAALETLAHFGVKEDPGYMKIWIEELPEPLASRVLLEHVVTYAELVQPEREMTAALQLASAEETERPAIIGAALASMLHPLLGQEQDLSRDQRRAMVKLGAEWVARSLEGEEALTGYREILSLDPVLGGEMVSLISDREIRGRLQLELADSPR